MTTTSPPCSEYHSALSVRLVRPARVCSVKCFQNTGTCWITRPTWGSGCPPTPKTSSPFTVKEGKVLMGDTKYFSAGCECLCNVGKWTALLPLCSRTHRHHGLHVADWQRPVWECSGMSLYCIHTCTLLLWNGVRSPVNKMRKLNILVRKLSKTS